MGFEDKLKAEQIEDKNEEGRGTWKLLAPLIYHAKSGVIYTVPTGFVTDFASVPRIPIVFALVGDRANEAATLHDWLYTAPHPVPTREMADDLLYEASISQGVPKWAAWLIYIGVRIGGASHWQPDAKAA